MHRWKYAIIGLALAAATAALVPDATAAGYRAERGYRYRSTYQDWDRGMSSYYNYSEADCRVAYGRGARYSTCYEFQPTQYVYVEERQYSSGYQQIFVYEHENDAEPYATYYAYDDGYTRRVERRDFHRHRQQQDAYISADWYAHAVAWDSLNWDNAADKMIVGSYTMLVGADVLEGASNDGEAIVGLTSVSLGALSLSLSSAQQIQEVSNLARAIRAQKKDALDIK